MFLDAVLNIKKENPQAAARFRSKTESGLIRLIEYPNSGKRVQEFPDLAFREILIPPYRFFYKRKDETIWIVAVWHGAQLPKRSTK
jgi:plasmid stabilization system protein ParE